MTVEGTRHDSLFDIWWVLGGSAMIVEEARVNYLSTAARVRRRCPGPLCGPCDRNALDTDAASIRYDLTVAEASLARIRAAVALE